MTSSPNQAGHGNPARHAVAAHIVRVSPVFRNGIEIFWKMGGRMRRMSHEAFCVCCNLLRKGFGRFLVSCIMNRTVPSSRAKYRVLRVETFHVFGGTPNECRESICETNRYT